MENNDLSQKVTEKLVVVLFLTLFTISIWGTVQIVEAFSPREETNTDYASLLKALPATVDTKILKELTERKEKYQLVKPAANTEETGASGDQPLP